MSTHWQLPFLHSIHWHHVFWSSFVISTITHSTPFHLIPSSDISDCASSNNQSARWYLEMDSSSAAKGAFLGLERGGVSVDTLPFDSALWTENVESAQKSRAQPQPQPVGIDDADLVLFNDAVTDDRQSTTRRLIMFLNCAYKTAPNMMYCMSFVWWPLRIISTAHWFVICVAVWLTDPGIIGAQNKGHGAWTWSNVYQSGGRDELCWWQYVSCDDEDWYTISRHRCGVLWMQCVVVVDVYCTQSVRAILIDLVPLAWFDFYPLCLWLWFNPCTSFCLLSVFYHWHGVWAPQALTCTEGRA